jgi:K+-sensing histidine kinase KdpD
VLRVQSRVPRAGAELPLIDDPRPAVRVASRTVLAVAVAAVALAAVAALEPLLSRPYFFPAFAAIVFTAVIAGGRYGAATTVVFAIGYAFWFLSPRGALAVTNPRELTALLGYSMTGCFVAAVGGALRKAFARVKSEHALLEQTLAQREDLLRALTHDVRSPLSAIGMTAALLARDAADASPDVQRRARAIQAAVAWIDAMLQDLVKVVALESGQVVLERRPVALPDLVHHLRETLAAALPMERVELRIPEELPPLLADPNRLERVLVNLLSNALKYSDGAVTVDAAQREGDVVVSVRDHGRGIAADELPRLFTKYYRASSAREREGLGLGLYISRLLVEAHAGRIWAESVAGSGSTFFVAIPVATGPSAPEPSRAPVAGG